MVFGPRANTRTAARSTGIVGCDEVITLGMRSGSANDCPEPVVPPPEPLTISRPFILNLWNLQKKGYLPGASFAVERIRPLVPPLTILLNSGW